MNSLRVEGQKTVAVEIVQQLDWQIPDVVIIPGGNLGNVSALGAGFEMMATLGLINKQPQIVVAQAEAANPLYLAFQRDWEFEPVTAQPTQASAIQIGNPVSVRKAIRTLKRHRGIVEQASEAELAEAAARADGTGMYNCPHTGVALAALIKLRERGLIDASARVVVVSTANGLKFTDFKLGYHERRLSDVHTTSRQYAGRATERLRRSAARHRRARGRRVLTRIRHAPRNLLRSTRLPVVRLARCLRQKHLVRHVARLQLVVVAKIGQETPRTLPTRPPAPRTRPAPGQSRRRGCDSGTG